MLHTNTRRAALAAVALALLLVACGGEQPSPTAPPTAAAAAPATVAAVQPTATASSAATEPAPVAESDTTPASPAATDTPLARPTVAPVVNFDPAALNLQLEPVAEGLSAPLYLTYAGDGSGRLFVVEKPGLIRIIQAAAAGQGQQPTLVQQPFLDIRDRVGSSGSEQGLLSVAFHPDYAATGRFFVDYTDRAGDTVLAEFQVTADPNRADPASERQLLTVDQPAANHNGGLVKFGPDGYLYVGMGDGGRGGDPWGNAQNTGVLLGKLLRLDVDAAEPYGVPADNPFVDDPNARAEIWAYGLRNPWRYSFDRATDDLWIADVGQNQYEEVDFQPADSTGGQGAANYGWNIMEASHCYPSGDSCDRSGLVLPVAEYDHSQGCSVTGGYVYRGSRYPAMQGGYYYGDYCSGIMWVTYRDSNGQWATAEVARTGLSLSSFGEDAAGELYVTDLSGGVYRLVNAG